MHKRLHICVNKNIDKEKVVDTFKDNLILSINEYKINEYEELIEKEIKNKDTLLEDVKHYIIKSLEKEIAKYFNIFEELLNVEQTMYFESYLLDKFALLGHHSYNLGFDCTFENNMEGIIEYGIAKIEPIYNKDIIITELFELDYDLAVDSMNYYLKHRSKDYGFCAFTQDVCKTCGSIVEIDTLTSCNDCGWETCYNCGIINFGVRQPKSFEDRKNEKINNNAERLNTLKNNIHKFTGATYDIYKERISALEDRIKLLEKVSNKEELDKIIGTENITFNYSLCNKCKQIDEE